MSGTFDLGGYPAPLGQPATPIAVFYYDPDSDEPYLYLPNIVPIQVDYREGPQPPTARFRYALDDTMGRNFGWPSRFDQVWPVDAEGDYVARQDDRLVVAGLNPDGSTFYLFDGFVQAPQVDLSPSGEGASFVAIGVAARAWDDTIRTRVERDAVFPKDASGNSDHEIQAECRFNPSDQRPGSLGGVLANSTSDKYYTTDPETGNKYPVFLDPLLVERQFDEQGDYLDYWFVSDALLYLLVQPSPADDYVIWPPLDTVTKLLQTLAPPPGSTVFDPKTAVPADCVIRDYDATHKPLPQAMADLLGYAGFLMCWECGVGPDGNPETSIRFYRRDGAAKGTPKDVYLDVPGASLADGSRNNLVEVHLARDVANVVNAWWVETRPKQVEITVVLAPAFQPAAGDAASTTRVQFQEANLANADADTRRKYRWYVADECGDGHWNMLNGRLSVALLDFSPAFPNNQDGSRSYAIRYRPGTHALVARDDKGRPLRATLEVYVGQVNGQDVYSADPYIQATATTDGWLAIERGWRLLDDRLGVEITATDPEDWTTGNPKMPRIAGISQCALAGQQGWKPFTLRLTTTVYADQRIDATADRRPASPTQFARWRGVDAHDHFQHCSITPGSIHYAKAGGAGGQPVVIRDDTDRAKAHAAQLRSAFEMPMTAGSVHIPGITTYYDVGDRLRSIVGRDIDLRTNVGASKGEAPTYPWIVGVSWMLDGAQYTELQLGDRRGDAGPHNSW